MKVAELREALEARGLDTRGTKPFLVSRLEDAISKDAAEVEEKGRLKEMKETILAESSSAPPGATTAAPSTPGRRSRRLSGEYAALAAGGTPARRRLLDSVTGSPSRIGSPARKTRRISGGEERPSTPSRRSRRLSGCSAGIRLLLLVVGQTQFTNYLQILYVDVSTIIHPYKIQFTNMLCRWG